MDNWVNVKEVPPSQGDINRMLVSGGKGGFWKPTSIQILPNGDVLAKRSGKMNKVEWYIILPDVPKRPKKVKIVKEKKPKAKPVLPHMKLGWPKNLIEQELDIYDVEITSEDFEEKIRSYQRLTEREKEMLLLYYKVGMTYEQIARAFDLTRERVRQIVIGSIKKLYSPLGREYLFGIDRRSAIGRSTLYALPDELSVREYNALVRGGIRTMEQLLRLRYEDVIKIRHCGKQSAEHIMEVVEKYNGNANSDKG